MKRWSVILAAVLCCSAFALAQTASGSETLISSDLIAWSYMQQPQSPEQGQNHQPSKPDPRPETQPASTPSSQPAQPQNAEASSQPGQSPTAQTFTGIVMKDTDSFTLKVSDSTSYKLDNQRQVQEYEGKRVRVTGTLDSSLNLIHVDRIEPLS
jgi:Protein of unknown function (DUF5818)